MDSRAKWFGYFADMRSLFSEWERRRVAGHPWRKRFREIHSACMFTLCLENHSGKRYLIGFMDRGDPGSPATINQLFNDNFAEVEDVDVILVDDPKTYGEATVSCRRCQLVSFLNQPCTTEAHWVQFLKKKLRVAADKNLELVINIEQEGHFNHAFLSAYLNHPATKCPYGRVFAFGQITDNPRKWLCVQLYPEWLVFPELTEDAAKALVLDREQYCKKLWEASQPPAGPMAAAGISSTS